MNGLDEALRAKLEGVLLQHEVEQALYSEAALLDARDYQAWLDFFTEDVVYWIPIRSTRANADVSNEFTGFDDIAFMNETRTSLEVRVAKLLSGYAHIEDPPSRTRHWVTNVRIIARPAADDLTVTCNMLVFRGRLDDDEDWWVGRRVDRLRKVGDAWKIARREIYLDQTVMTSKNVSAV